jgi:acyl dehydratase
MDLEPRTYRITRADRVALAVGLPGVIAHGMYTLALAARYVDEWVGEPGHVVELGAKFTKPVVVPAGDGAEVEISGVVTDRDGVRTVSLTVMCEGQKVLGNPKAVLRG